MKVVQDKRTGGQRFEDAGILGCRCADGLEDVWLRGYCVITYVNFEQIDTSLSQLCCHQHHNQNIGFSLGILGCMSKLLQVIGFVLDKF